MSSVPPSIDASSFESLRTLLADYRIYRTITDPAPPPGMYSSQTIAVFDWLDALPDVADQLAQWVDAEQYARDHVVVMREIGGAAVYGPRRTLDQRELLERRSELEESFREGLGIVTSNIGGAAGMAYAQQVFPDDLTSQNALAGFFKTLTEVLLNSAEMHTAREEDHESRNRPGGEGVGWATGSEGRVKDPDPPGNVPGRALGEDMPGLKTFDWREREREAQESRLPERQESRPPEPHEYRPSEAPENRSTPDGAPNFSREDGSETREPAPAKTDDQAPNFTREDGSETREPASGKVDEHQAASVDHHGLDDDDFDND